MNGAQGTDRKTAGSRPSLFKSVGPGRAAGMPPAPAIATDETDHQPSSVTANRTAVRGRRDREDKRQIAGFFSPECAKQLRMLAAEQDTTVQELLKEGLNLMFLKHGKAPIA
jgi:hypothetical protein